MRIYSVINAAPRQIHPFEAVDDCAGLFHVLQRTRLEATLTHIYISMIFCPILCYTRHFGSHLSWPVMSVMPVAWARRLELGSVVPVVARSASGDTVA